MEQKFNQTEMRFIADLTAMVLNVIKNSRMNQGRRILRVKELTNIKQKQYYYKVLVEAERRGVIIKTYDEYHRVAIMLSH